MADDIVSQYYLANALRQGQRQSTRSILAQRMMGNALDSSPTTPLGALARALTGVVAGYAMQNAEQGDRLDQKQALSALMDRDQQQQDEAAAWSARMNGQGGQPPAGGAAPAPAPVMREALPGIGGPAQGGTRQNPAQPGGTAPPGQAGVMPAEMAPLFDAASRETGVPVHILSAVARHESDYGRIPSRPRDGQGVMQVLQSTAAAPGYGVQPLPPAALNDPAQNIAFGARYLAARAPRGTDWSNPEHIAAALRAYNGGGDPDYVRKVMQYIPQAAPGGTVDASAPADVQATLDRLRQQATAPGATAAGGGALPPSSAAAAPATSAAPAPANASLTPSQAMTPERLAWLEQGRASRNPEIRRRAQAELDAWQATRQMAGDQRLEAAAARQEERDRQAMAEQARQQARQDERDRLAQEAAARAEVRANQGPIPQGMRMNPQTQQLEPIPGFTPPSSQPTEQERISAGYASRMMAAEQTLSRVVQGGFNPGNWTDATMGRLPIVGNALTSEGGQLYRQAQEDWVRAKLRRESGAVIGAEEMAQEIRTYFPQPGDTPAMIAQKEQARLLASQAMVGAAGRGTIINPPEAPAAPPAGAVTHRFNPQTGQVEAVR